MFAGHLSFNNQLGFRICVAAALLTSLAWAAIATTPAPAQAYSDESWIQPETISSSITDHNDLGSPRWSLHSTETRSAPGPFSKTTPADGALIYSSSITLEWEESSSAFSYRYCYDTSNDGNCDDWTQIWQNHTTLTGLDSNTTYYWHVRTTNEDGTTYSNGSETAYWSFTTAHLISPDDGVVTMAILTSSKILIGGYFTQVNGVSRNHIARLNADGSLDTSFNPNINDRVDAITIQADGKILVGGAFTQVGISDRNHIARLNPNGTLDDTFDPDVNESVYAIAVQPDGKILIGGNFTKVGTTDRSHFARLNPNGTLDAGFSNVSLDDIVRTIAIQPDEMILIGGAFKNVNAEKRTFIARLDKYGDLDGVFNPDFDDYLMTVVLQPDGKILVGGQFTVVNGEAHAHIVRLEPSGEIDKSFLADADDSIVSIALQTDGKMILGGYFTQVNSTMHRHIVRLDAEGNVDDLLQLDTNDLVTSVCLHGFGRILAGGLFSEANGEDQNYFARWDNDLSSMEAFTLNENASGHTITWKLANEQPLFQRVTYELAIDIPINYSMLGEANFDGGNQWVLTGVTLPKGQPIFIRALGYYSTGLFNGSGSIYRSTCYTILYYNIYLPMVLK